MPTVSSHANGAPCWFELATSDQKSANQFYKSLFGWEVIDNPMGEGMTYSMYLLGGNNVGACYSLMPDMVQAGIPPHWGVYFSTSNADGSAAKVTELGGSIKQPPFDVFEFGRMAVCADPEGAVFSVWQPKQHPGATIVGELNTVCWTELATRDTDKAAAFYKSLFGWSTKDSTGQPVRYIEFSPAGAAQPAGGLLQMDAQWEGVPSYWGIYFRVADTDKAVEHIKQSGGQVKHGPFDVPNVGPMAVCADPQGAMFSVVRLLG
jgi:predicted enzyme related to lactoylglutathione lyase